ncbi:MAG: PD-(D/E)XK nuclease family protein [Planctomycetes bacterium]|nr:PD-(D/E)XK nuclease family protein [Planctomycetota bacterium]
MAFNDYPSFSWSLSRKKVFETCKRQYYFQYYGYWGGWNAPPASVAYRAYRLKNMTTLPMLLGSIVHEVIEDAIKGYSASGSIPEYFQLAYEARKRLSDFWERSLAKEWKLKPKSPNLFEHGVGREFTREQRGEVREQIVRCFRNLYDSEKFRLVLDTNPESYRVPERLASTRIDGVEVFGVPDMALRTADDAQIIIDWKTGKQRGDGQDQLSTYGLFITRELGFEPCRIEGYLVYLDPLAEVGGTISAESIKSAEENARKSILDMISYIEDRVVNKPKSAEHFPKTTDENECKRCFFQELCHRDSALKLFPEAGVFP